MKSLLNRLILTHQIDNQELIDKMGVLDNFYKHRQFDPIVYEELDMLVTVALIMMIVDDRKHHTFYTAHISSMIEVLHWNEIILTTHDGAASKLSNVLAKGKVNQRSDLR